MPAQSVKDLIAILKANPGTAQPHIRAGRLRALGVGTRVRTPLFPEIPTIAEAGVPGYEANNWNGIVVPRKTAPAIIGRLHREVLAVLNDATAKKRFTAQGLEPIGDTPAEFSQYLRHEAAKWGKLIKTAGITRVIAGLKSTVLPNATC
ncbi:MAG TPA: tripartite tricarboxylate transporter substrate-binding protein [Burkholderiales bacterium]